MDKKRKIIKYVKEKVDFFDDGNIVEIYSEVIYTLTTERQISKEEYEQKTKKSI